MTEQVALISGAGQGAGRAIAARLVSAGVRVVLAGRTASKVQDAAAQLGEQASAYTLDVTDSAAVAQCAQAVEKQFGHLDMLVNCAGEAFISPLEQCRDEDWDRILNVNLKAPFLMSRAFLPLLRKSPNASIINILSKVALSGYAGVSVYTAAKTGLLGFSRSLGVELKSDEIRVVAFCPGPMDTPMRWSATPDFDRKVVINADTLAELVWQAVNLPRGVTMGEILVESIHYG